MKPECLHITRNRRHLNAGEISSSFGRAISLHPRQLKGCIQIHSLWEVPLFAGRPKAKRPTCTIVIPEKLYISVCKGTNATEVFWTEAQRKIWKIYFCVSWFNRPKRNIWLSAILLIICRYTSIIILNLTTVNFQISI